MQLSNYTIHGNGDNKIIFINNTNYMNLQELLNTNLKVNINVVDFLNDLYEINNNWNNLNSIVENKYNGFWDWEILQNYGFSGNWFTFAGYEDYTIYICVDTENIYIENDLLPQYPVVEMPVNEFIDVLEQWRDI